MKLPPLFEYALNILFIAGLATAIALPDGFIANAIETRGIPGFPELVRNASALFGWEIVAIAKDQQQLNTFCAGFDRYAGRWATIGLDISSIKYPICTSAARTTAPSTEDIRNQIYTHHTDIFITQVLNALETTSTSTVQGPTPLVYLCQSALSYRRLDQFSLLPNRVMAAVCEVAGVSLRPQDFGPEQQNATAVNYFIRAVSALLANKLATAAETADDLAKLCFAAPDYLTQLSAIGLDGAVTWQYLCYIWMPLTTGEALTKVVEASTEAFMHEIMHVDRDIPGWTKWLCENLSSHGMRRVGLNGDMILSSVC